MNKDRTYNGNCANQRRNKNRNSRNRGHFSSAGSVGSGPEGQQPGIRRLAEAVQAVERSSFVTLGQGRIIENGLDEPGDLSFELEDRLADVEQFGFARRLAGDGAGSEISVATRTAMVWDAANLNSLRW